MTDNNVKKPELKQMPVEVQDETIESVQEVCDTVETNEDDEPEVLNFDDMELEPISDIALDGVEEAESASNDEGLEAVDTLEGDESEELNLDDLAEPEIPVEENNTKDKMGIRLLTGWRTLPELQLQGPQQELLEEQLVQLQVKLELLQILLKVLVLLQKLELTWLVQGWMLQKI